MNPWGLNAKQERVLDALIECGCNKSVARQLEMPLRTVESHLRSVLLRMDAASRVQAAIHWDRYRRGNAT